MKHTFSLIALDLRNQPEGHILKTLKNQIYFFDKRYIEDKGRIVYRSNEMVDSIIDELYGENLRIQAIVGKNGSGKSSLLELIYRIVNNLSFALQTISQSQWTTLYSINELRACLYYYLNGQVYSVCCYNNYVLWESVDFKREGSEKVIFQSTWEREKFDFKDLIKASRELFYLIVTNYSPHSLVSDDYRDEKVSYYNHGVMYERDDTSWMPCLFHKNDGYITPICLAPYREDNGAINISKELRLTTYRLSSIFLYYYYIKKETNVVIDGYSLDDIQYEYDPKHSLEKFNNYNGLSTKSILYSSNSSIAKQILQLYDVHDNRLMQTIDVYRSGCEYLVAKVYAIVDTYQSYVRYRKLFFKRRSGSRMNELQNGISGPLADPELKPLLEKLIEKTNKDNSHITVKLRQTLAMLRYIKRCEECNEDHTWLTDDLEKISFADYVSKVHPNNPIATIVDMQALLPPPIFNIDIRLQKKRGKLYKTVSLNHMSSGERQLLFVLSTYIYHILNLKSINDDPERVSYQNICLVLDEVEICFHPDYQRQFINRLVNTLIDLEFNKDYYFYILMATHSPFMLSDISQQDILYLDNGEDVSDEINVNPFCANVNDILAQSFFLNRGFSGEFAINKIRELMSFLKSKVQRNKYGWTIEKAENFIENMVGDPLLQAALRVMLKDKPKK